MLAACAGPPAVARPAVRKTHVPEIAAAVQDDLARHRKGIAEAAKRLAPRFVVADAEARERGLRYGLRNAQEPPKGIGEFVASPMGFLAAVGVDGKVLARDVTKVEDDRMRGKDFAALYPVVREALANGEYGEALAPFGGGEGAKAGTPSSWSMLFVAPVRVDGVIVGAVVAGVPLGRWAQRMSRQGQLALTDEPGFVYWVFAYKGDQLFAPQSGIDLGALLPDGAARKAGLGKSPGGYTGTFDQFGRTFAFGVLPVPSIADDAGFIAVRGEPAK